MASINKVFIMGNLGQDPELRYTQNQVPVVTLNVATTESWNKDGQKQEQTEWHRVIVWNRQAENCAKYLSKGRSVFIEGKLQTRSWDDKNGQKRYTTEISASNIQFLPAAGATNQGNMGTQQYSAPEASQERNYFPGGNQQRSNQSSSQTNANSIDELDDIPF